MSVDKGPSQERTEMFIDRVNNTLGIQLDHNGAKRSIANLKSKMGYHDDVACLEHLLDHDWSNTDLQTVVCSVIVPETYFFREGGAIRALRVLILPNLIDKQRAHAQTLNIWCAACSTGEEPYSIALMLNYMLKDAEKWSIKIYGTDICESSLMTAKLGQYSPSSLHKIPISYQQGICQTSDTVVAIDDHVRNLVTFSRLNLADNSYPIPFSIPNSMDLIFLRNALIYFSPKQCKHTLDKLIHTLKPGGYLVVGAAETHLVQHPKLFMINGWNFNLFQKVET